MRGKCRMELNINSPIYFKDQYGIDNEVYRFCQKVYLHFKEREYSDTLHIIGIVPVVAPEEIRDSCALWKESVQLLAGKTCASICIHMDFDRYYEADSLGKILLTQEMILRAVKKVKSKGRFDYETFVEDFKLFCEEYGKE